MGSVDNASCTPWSLFIVYIITSNPAGLKIANHTSVLFYGYCCVSHMTVSWASRLVPLTFYLLHGTLSKWRLHIGYCPSVPECYVSINVKKGCSIKSTEMYWIFWDVNTIQYTLGYMDLCIYGRVYACNMASGVQSTWIGLTPPLSNHIWWLIKPVVFIK